jgi:hypothetical protein
MLNVPVMTAPWRSRPEGATGPFPAFVQFLLLTGARRSEAAEMARSELAGADWTLPAARNKVRWISCGRCRRRRWPSSNGFR